MTTLEEILEAQKNPPALEKQTTEESISTSDADVQVTPIDIWTKIGAQPVDELVEWLKGFVFGEPGVGKTYLGGTAGMSELCSPGLILDIDGGITTIRRFPNLKARQIRTLSALSKVFEDIHSAIDRSDPQHPKLPFKFLMIDSITELQKIDMLEIMGVTKAVIEGRQDKYVPSEREWFISQGHMREIIRKFKDLPCHVLFTAHLDPKRNSANQMVNGPDLPGKLRNQISGFFDVVGFLYVSKNAETGETERRIQFAKTDTTIAKDRLGVLGQVVVNPTFPMLVEKLHHQGEKVND